MNKQVALILLLFAPVLSQAQYLSESQHFQVVEKKGCNSLLVTISNTNLKPLIGICGPANPCDITWGDGSPQEQITTNTANHVYSQAGTFTLNVRYQNNIVDNIQIVVTPNTPPTFNIFTCGGDEVQVRVTDTNYDAYIINYNDGDPEVQVPKGSMAVNNHAFATSGVKTISVRGKDVNADDNCGPANQNVLAMATLPTPFINKLEVINDIRIDLEFTTLSNIQYRLEIARNNNSTWQLVQTVYNNTTASIPGLRTDDNYYCFRLGAFDPCNNTIAYSNTICSADFDATATNNANNLAWVTNSTGINDFSISRDGLGIANPLAGSTSYVDNNVTCKLTYCYQLTTNYNNSSRSISLNKCVTTFSSDIPTPITDATAVVTSTGVDIFWQQDPTFQPVEYSVFRKQGSGNFQLLNKVPGQSFTDSEYTSEGIFCYQINYIDICDNIAPFVNSICPFRLSAALTSENYTLLNWSEYTGWENGVDEYVIEKYSEQGVLLQTFTVGPGTFTYTDTSIDPNEQVYRYVVKANANTPGLGQAVSNETILIKEAKIIYPTAFTPDNQGPVDNEIFKVFGQYISKFEMHIFNRWGELLFVSNNIDMGWDGTYKGSQVPDGTYAFVARLKDLNGNSFTRSGSIVLMRKK